jgi:hypothetical protein
VTYTYDFFDSGGGTALIIDDKLGLIGETGRETLSRTTTLTETTTNTATFEPISAVCLSGTFFSTVTVTVGTPTPTPTTVTPTPIPPTPTPTTPPDDTAEGSVTRAGGEVSTGDDATASDPVETTVTVPPGTAGGVVAILEGSITETPPTGFSFFGQQVDIVAPDATVHSPLVIAFSVHTSIAGSDPDAVNAFMNGVSIGVCADAGATPDPCIESRSLVGDDIEIIVRTTTASRWNFGMPVPGGADCLCEVQNIQPNQVALKNVGSDGKGSTLNRNMILIVHGVDAPGASCDPGDLSDPTKVELTMVDDDFDLIVFKRGKTIVCNGETTTNVKIGVRFEGPLNCKDSAVPGGGSRAQSVGLITSTGTGSAGTTVYVEATKIRCRSK